MATYKKHVAKDGTVTWRMRVYAGRDARGKRRFILETFDRLKDAKDRAAKLESGKGSGALTAPSREPLADYLTRWLDEVKEGRLRARTLHEYRGMLGRYVVDPPDGCPPIGAIRLNRLTPQAFEALYAWLWRERGLAPRTLRYLHTVLRQALGHAVKTGALGRNPTDHVSPATQARAEGREPAARETVRAMSEDEAARFLEAAREDRYHALWCMLLMGGIRPGEALGLAWDDVDVDGCKVHVRRALTRVGVEGWRLVEPKTKKARRVVVLPDVAVQALREWRAAQARERLLLGSEYQDHGHAFVFTNPFGAPLDGGNLYSRNFNRIMEAAGLGERQVRQGGKWIPETAAEGEGRKVRRRFKPSFRVYDLRHTCATLLLKKGVNPKIVQERLGHASITLTLDTYSHVLPDMQEGAADELQAIFGTGG